MARTDCRKRIGIGTLIATVVAGCAHSGVIHDFGLTPLTARPEEPDSTNIVEQNDLMASASPNGELLVFTSARSGTFRLYTANTDGSNQRVITSGPGTQMQGSWSPDGERIAFVHREEGGRYLAIVDGDGSNRKLLTDSLGGWPIPMWSPDGKRILYHAPGPMGEDDLWSIDPGTGDREVLFGSAASDRQPMLSPDGRHVVFTSRRDGEDEEIYVADIDGESWLQLTDNEASDYTPSWSPDGGRIVFQSVRAGRWTIFTINADGSDETPITRYPMQWDPVWSHDGTEIFFNSGRDGRRGIYAMYADGSNPRKLTNTEPGAFVSIVREAGVDEAIRAFRDAKARYPEATFFYEREVRYLGQNYLEMGQLREAELLFGVNVQAFPRSKATHLDLGNVRLAAGEIVAAIESYTRALKLDPEDEQLSARLQRLRNETGRD